jgi:hypothetical protein
MGEQSHYVVGMERISSYSPLRFKIETTRATDKNNF